MARAAATYHVNQPEYIPASTWQGAGEPEKHISDRLVVNLVAEIASAPAMPS
jgi:hypothetical protein